VSEQILINVTPQEARVAVIESGAVQELHVERTSARGLVGNIYVGRVARVLPGMQSAFIEIGLPRAAFLHVADIFLERNNGQAETRPIERLLAEGQSILVQVIKDPIGSKGARLSTQIGIAGRLLVYLPQEHHIGISQRIQNEAEREHLRETLQQLLPQNEKGGFIIRTVAESATDKELHHDVDYLSKLWNGIQEAAKSAATQTLLYQDLHLPLRVIRDFVGEDTERILVDSGETFDEMRKFAESYSPGVYPVIEHYLGERPLFDVFAVEEEIERALARRVELKSGGYVIFDQTEALTTVDVNTGAFVGGRSFDDTVFRTNLEAAQTIARQLRLRNLGGIILVDFIDMENTEHREAVLAELKKALSRDRTRTTVNGFTQLGLVEMTRKRTRESIAHVLCEPCPICQGRGEIKTARTVCFEILREILRTARQFDAREYRVFAAQGVIDLFLDEEAASLAHLEGQIGKRIALQVENAYHQETFDVVLV
jgi:ribonuclease G